LVSVYRPNIHKLLASSPYIIIPHPKKVKEKKLKIT